MSDSTLNEDEELFTDIAIQMFSAYSLNENNAVLELMESYRKSYGDNPAFMPGVIFAFIMHMGILISSLADAAGIDSEEAYRSYVNTYNTELRPRLAKMESLHPSAIWKLMADLGILNDTE